MVVPLADTVIKPYTSMVLGHIDPNQTSYMDSGGRTAVRISYKWRSGDTSLA